MSLSHTGKNGTTSDSPAREFNNTNEHGEALNSAGGAWRGHGGRGRGRWGGGGGGRADERLDWRREDREGGDHGNNNNYNNNRGNDGEERFGGGRGGGYRGGSRGGRGRGRGTRHYDANTRDEQFSSWRRGDDERGGEGGRGGGGAGGEDRFSWRRDGGGYNNNEEGYTRRPRGGGGRGRGRHYDNEREFGDGAHQQEQEQPQEKQEEAPKQNIRQEPKVEVEPEVEQWEKDQEEDQQQEQQTRRGRFDMDSHDRTRGRGRDRPSRGRGGQSGGGGGGYNREVEEDRQQPRSSEDPISTNPNRTQRAPHLRKNCHDEKEIEQLFDHHHQQKGISLDNYANIPVDIVPRDVEPVESFEDLYVEPALALNISKCGYKQPTPVQRYGIPVCLNGDDLMACAQTGSGKTAAFLVPVVHHILKNGVSPARNRVSHPIAVIMAPTRELALQIFDEVRKLTFRTDIFYDVVYGGTPYPTRFENDILVACPGRLKDIFDRGMVSFSQVKFLVLDEADRMLEMGFEEQIEYLVASRYTDMPQTTHRQTLMFSATFPQRILSLAKRYLRQQYYLLTVGRVGSTTKNITQRLERVQETDKVDKLFEIIYQQKQTDLVLVFVETKRAAEDLHYALKSEGIPSSTIHGDRKQFDRERALRDFKEGITPILVATDVASRGLDIPNVAHVIQYDLPKEMDDYTHRIGRTGRAGNKGVATAFYNKNNRNLALDLYNYLREHEQDVPVWFEEEKDSVEGDRFIGANRGGPGGRRAGGGGDGPRAAPVLSNSTWGESTAPRGRARGAGRNREGQSNVDDGGF